MQTNRILKSPVDQVKEIPKISVGKLFFDGIKRHGDRVCLVAGVSDERLTFRQILEKSVKLAVALKRLGLKRNDVISLVSENHIEAYIPYLASLYSGIILNVLNPDYTKYELQISLERLCPKYVFCTNSALQKLQQLKPNFPTLQSIVLIGSSVDEGTIHLENLINVGETDISNYQPEEFDPNEQIAMTYNSSGTTGLPKNVLLTHSNVRTVLIQCGVLEGHSDAITCAGFSPDGTIIVTTCNNSDFRLWAMETNIFINNDAHDLGIQSCDFSENLEPIPNVDLIDCQYYLLATSGNDGLVNLWSIALEKVDDNFNYESVRVNVWRTLRGHGGNVFCVRFSPGAGELVCSTATDRQARIWSVYSADCLHVLDHNSIVTSCSFSKSCEILITGCLDKTLWVWKLPQQLVFQTVVANRIKSRVKILADWLTKDVLRWLKDVGLEDISESISCLELDGEKIVTMSPEDISADLQISDEQKELLTKELKWLKQDEQYFNSSYWSKINDIPDEYICPITQEIMREPVRISDGFTYEKRAITEWFMSGKFTSPMTNAVLENTDYAANQELRNAIHTFLYDEE